MASVQRIAFGIRSGHSTTTPYGPVMTLCEGNAAVPLP
jgi:hypothetical protein